MIIIGITGPTGSGKTTALKCVEGRGGCVLDLDAVYHRLLKEEPRLLQALDARFPGTVKDGELDRKALGSIVFKDPQALEDLNGITGSFIRDETMRLLREAEAAGRPIAAIDAINLLETDLKNICDHLIAVTAPVETRVRRLMVRDGISEEYARMRISAQKSNEYFESRCGYALRNDADPESFRLRCEALLDQLLAAADVR